MTMQFDVFRVETDEGVLWRGAAATLEEAKTRVQELATSAPGMYLILNQQAGRKLTIQCDGERMELHPETAVS